MSCKPFSGVREGSFYATSAAWGFLGLRSHMILSLNKYIKEERAKRNPLGLGKKALKEDEGGLLGGKAGPLL